LARANPLSRGGSTEWRRFPHSASAASVVFHGTRRSENIQDEADRIKAAVPRDTPAAASVLIIGNGSRAPRATFPSRGGKARKCHSGAPLPASLQNSRCDRRSRARARERAWVRDAPAGNASLPVARWRSITRMNRSFLSTDILRLPLRTGSEALDRSLVFSDVAIKRLMSRCVSERFER